VVLVIMGFVMGLQIMFTISTVIDSGVATTFVCLAEDPAALARTKPELFERIRETWPAVVQVRTKKTYCLLEGLQIQYDKEEEKKDNDDD